MRFKVIVLIKCISARPLILIMLDEFLRKVTEHPAVIHSVAEQHRYPTDTRDRIIPDGNPCAVGVLLAGLGLRAELDI